MRPFLIMVSSVCALLLLICLAGCTLLWPDYLPYTFQAHSSIPKVELMGIGLADLDGDHRLEYWRYLNSEDNPTYPKTLEIFDDANGIMLGLIADTLQILGVLPVPADLRVKGLESARLRLLVSQKTKLDCFLYLYDLEGRLLWRRQTYRGIDRNGNGEWDGSIIPYQIADLNRDGFYDVLAAAHTSYDLYPRGIWAFDLHNGDTLWTYPMGCTIGNIFLHDMNQDGFDDILISTGAPGNGAQAGTTDDFHTYAIILDAATGKEMLQQEVCSGFSSGTMAVVNGQEEGIFLAVLGTSGAPSTSPSIIHLYRGWPLREVRAITDPRRLSGLIAADIVGDAKEELVVGSYDQSLIAYDIYGRIKATRKTDTVYGPIGLIPKSGELDQDVILCLPVEASAPALGVGRKLRPLFALGQIERVFYEGLSDIALVSSSEMRIGQFVHVPLPLPYRELLIFSFGAAGIVLILWLISLFQMPLTWNLINRDFACGIIWLNRRGKILKSNQAARSILPEMPQTLPAEIRAATEHLRAKRIDALDLEITLGKEQHERLLKIHLRSFLRGTLVSVTDATDTHRARFLRTWGEGIGRIVHAFKSPASSIQMSLKQLRPALANPEALAHIENQSELLLNYSQQFKKVFSLLDLKLEFLEINQLIRRIVLHYIANYQDRIQLDFIAEDEKLFIKGDREQIEIMLRCLLDNAVEALEGSGQVNLRSRRTELVKGQGAAWVEQMAEIEISDNGSGMDEPALELALKPGHSTKERGMGLGLPQSKLIVELHGGAFEIRSQPGVGTTIWMRFPLQELDHE